MMQNRSEYLTTHRYIVFAFLVTCSVLFLLYSISEISISYQEATIFFEQKSFIHYVSYFSCTLFGQNDFALRAPFLLTHVLSTLLLYKISKTYVRSEKERLICVLFYVLLPGVNAAAVLVNAAVFVIFFTLLFLWLWQNKLYMLSYATLVVSLFVDNSFVMLYISLALYGYFRKQRVLMVLSLALLALSLYMFGFDTYGKPKGHFLDTFGVYAATFSPLLFLYYIYTLYRILIKERKSMLWYISFGAFAFALVVSIRQRLMLEDFLPFGVIAIPLMIRVFFNSYRVRLPRFRRGHHLLLVLVTGFLMVNFALTIENKLLYSFYKNPKKHFAYKHHVAKELSLWLKNHQVSSLFIEDEKLRQRVAFYGVKTDAKAPILKNSQKKKDIVINYFGKIVASFALQY